MKIKTIDEDYFKFTELNNIQPEITEHVSSNGYKSYSMVVRDFLKYPDQFSSLVQSLSHFKNEKEVTGRPGATYSFSVDTSPRCSFFIRKCLFEIFKINLECTSLYTNCFSGIMDSHKIPPHCDVEDPRNLNIGPHLVCNLGLTKGSKGGTSFWTFLKKSGVLEMGYEDINSYTNYMDETHELNDINEWENTDEDGEWKLEYIVPWGYNELVIYSPMLFHQPYFKKEWFLDKDRLSLASMYNVKTEEINMIPEEFIRDAYDVWKKFELCKILNYYF
jgi:hypothetical protein